MRLLSILLCIIMVVSLMPTTVLAAQQQISAVVATSPNVDTIPTLYGSLKIPSFTITQGSPAYITASDANLRWQKKVEGVWTNQDTGRFSPGEWRISASLRLDNDGALQYDFAQNLTFKVNGEFWTVETPNNHGEYSYAWVYSPAFTIVDDPNIQPPVSVESVHMVLNGYTPGAAAASATVTTDANVTVEVLGFVVAIDSNGDGQPDALEPVTGNFESGKMYAVGLQIKAKSGYDISELTMEKVTLDRALMPVMGQYNSEEDVFAGMCMLSDAMQYTVTFETNGGSTIQPVTVGGGTAVAKPADPTKPYFAFAGWYTDSNLTKSFDFENTPITGDITLYAKWTPSPVNGMFLMTFDFNGATSTIPTVGEVSANSAIYLNDNLGNFVTPPSGKVLAGYEIDGVPYAIGTEYLVTQNITVKLLWKDAPVTTYNVSFNANGGSGTMADVTGISGEYTLPSNGFTAPSGKKFKAWIVDGSEKAVGDKVTVSANTTITAVWEDLPPVHVCELTPISKVEPSCVDGGKKAYYKCLGCGKAFEDELGSVLIPDIDAWGNIEKTDIHKDGDGDGKCDTCRADVDNGFKPPQTGDNNMMLICFVLVLISGLGILCVIYGKKYFLKKEIH